MYAEKMPNLYTLEKDLNDRLSHSIIRYDGVPVLCIYKSKKTLQIYHPVTSALLEEIRPDDPKLDISSIEVGYMNYFNPSDKKNKVYYLTRNTSKKYVQGLTSGNLRSYTLDNEPSEFHQNVDVTRNEGFYNSLTGEFPIIHDVIKSIRAGEQQAVALDVALRKSRIGITTLYYRNKELGYFEDGSEVFKCNDPYRWVFERYLSRFNLKME